MYCVFALLALTICVHASPIAPRQAVTASIAPSAAAPAGCMPTFTGSFGIAVQNISMPTMAAKRQVSQISDGQIQAPTAKPSTTTAAAMMIVGMASMISDGQVQAGFKTVVIMPVAPVVSTMAASIVVAVTEFSDGQPQVPTSVPMTTPKPIVITPSPTMMTLAAVTEFTDGQPQAPKITAMPVTVLSDGQPQAPLSTAKPSTTVMVTSIISKAPVMNATTMMTPAASMMPIVGGQQIVACATNGTLELTLANGILKDSHGRTGYIASNFQFQFDDPPQAGAIFTAGFSVCANGSLALGGSNVFYQCLSGSFYNLYNQNWAPQCSPVTIETLMLINCAT